MPGASVQSRAWIAITVGVLLGAGATVAHSITLGQIDDFEDGSTAGWSHGTPSPIPPENVSGGGPDGSEDNYLANFSTGGGGPGSRLAMFNRDQWTGDYTSEGVAGVRMAVANFGNAPLSVRIAFEGSNGTRYASSEAFELPADGIWRTVLFGLSEEQLTSVLGNGDLPSTLADVTELRVISAQSGPSWIGDAIVATLGVDDITTSESSVSTENPSWTDLKLRF